MEKGTESDMKLHPYWHLLKYWKVLLTLLEKKGRHQSYPAVNPERYNNDLPAKTYPLM